MAEDGRHGPSFTMVPNAIIHDSSLTCEERGTLILLMSYGDDIFPGRQTVAAKLNVSRATVDRIKQRLKERGYLTWERRGTKKAERGVRTCSR